MFMYSYCYICSVLCIPFHCVVLCIVCVPYCCHRVFYVLSVYRTAATGCSMYCLCTVLLPPGVISNQLQLTNISIKMQWPKIFGNYFVIIPCTELYISRSRKLSLPWTFPRLRLRLLGRYTARVGSCLPTFRGNLFVSSSRLKNSKTEPLLPWMWDQ